MTSTDLTDRVHRILVGFNRYTGNGPATGATSMVLAGSLAEALNEDHDDVQAALDQLVVDGRVRTATVYGALNRPRVESSDLVDEIARRLADLTGSRAFRRENHEDASTRFRAAARAAVDYLENAA